MRCSTTLMRMALSWVLSAMMFWVSLPAKTAPAVELQVHAGNRSLTMNRLGAIADARHRELSVTRLDLLLSGMSFQRSDGSWTPSNGWHGFFRAEQPHRRQPLPQVTPDRYQALRFAVGVEPEANHADPNRLAPDDPLHPVVNGLHWGWTGGYVFLALEGHWQFDQAPRGTSGGYSWHVAGNPHRVWIELRQPLEIGPSSIVRLRLDVARLVKRIDIRRDGDATHSRDEDAVVRALKASLLSAFTVQLMDTSMPETAKTSLPRSVPATARSVDPYPLAVSTQLPRLALPPDNPPTLEGVELGRLLFHDPRLSRGARQSCASCHRASDAFADAGAALSIGVKGQAGLRNAMPLFNLAWVDEFFWDGRVKGLRHQVLHPIVDPLEMAATLPQVLRTLNADRTLRQRFQRVFGGPATEARLGLALEQFLLTRVSQDSKFDRVMLGAERFTPSEQRGLELFLTEHDPPRGLYGADCFHCHGGGLFTNQRFTNNGLRPQGKDRGRERVTGDPADRGKFRTPSLRNVALTGPYMHDGRFLTLEDVIEHYNHGVQRGPTLDPNLAKHPPQGLGLSRQDQVALVDFLRTLTDPQYRAARP